MATIVRLGLETGPGRPDPWPRFAEMTLRWVSDHGIALRDAIVLLPFLQLLPLARRAFARAGGWQPRIETTQTLAAALGPAPAGEPGQVSFDASVDALVAAQLLRSQAWGAAWARRDARGFERAAGEVVDTAHALVRGAHARPPEQRGAYWEAAREAVAPGGGPGATERLLARVAIEWASFAPAPTTDRLFAAQPSAWIALQAGGPDPLTMALLEHALGRSLLIDADSPPEQLFEACAKAFAAPSPATRGTPPGVIVRDGFEDEAQAAAAQVLEHLRRGEQPVGLVAQDRLLVRRVRALLERRAVPMLDETGWKLSTTRAAAQVMSLLNAARADAGTDALFDWLKAGARWPGFDDPAASIGALEALCRRRHVWRIAHIDPEQLFEPTRAWWASVVEVLTTFMRQRRQPLAAWLDALVLALRACGALASLEADDAGRQVLTALKLDPAARADGAWSGPAATVAMGLDEFTAWIDAVMEQETFRAAAPAGAAAHVVITPLARAMLRPFAALVLAGADDKHLAGPASRPTLLGDTVAAALGLPTAATRRDALEQAFVHALAVPRVTFLRRRLDGADPLAASPLVERLALALERRGVALERPADPRPETTFPPMPIERGAPSAPALLPARWSASSVEALRACPYRFFALHMLRLREDDELDGEVEKRDYGTWLHAVLHRFHTTRARPAPAADEIARLMQVGLEQRAEHGLEGAEFLPFAASFATFAPRYIAWLHTRDADGAVWRDGELRVGFQPGEMPGAELYGVIDRVDDLRGGAVELIDYKTGGAQSLKDKVNQPLEDTQLAFYATLMRGVSDSGIGGTPCGANVIPLRPDASKTLRASYLALDGTKRLEQIEHPDVDTSAAALREGLARDLRRLRGGAGMPALGEGVTCDYCEARGLCRRDHWSGAAGAGSLEPGLSPATP